MLPFSTNLRRRAEDLGISNAEVARRVGLSERRYANYVSGKREPDLATLVRIAEALGVMPDNLLLAVQTNEKPTSASVFKDRLLLAAHALDESDLEILAVQAEAVMKLRTSSSGRR